MSLWKKVLFHAGYLSWKQIVLPILALCSGSKSILIPDYLPPLITFRVKLYIVFHDTFYWENPTHYNRIWRWYMVKLTNLAIKIHRPEIIATSFYVRDRIKKLFPEGLPIHVVYQSPKLLPVPIATQPPNFRYFLHIGTLEKRKNLKSLVHAFQLFKEINPLNMKLVLIGGGSPSHLLDEELILKKIVDSYFLQDEVLFKGYLSDQEIAYWYQNASAFVFPSQDEGFGIPVVESIKQGIPTIISNRGSLPEIADGSCLIWKSDGSESLAQLMQEVTIPERVADLKQRGFQRATRFSRERFIQDLDQVLSTSLS